MRIDRYAYSGVMHAAGSYRPFGQRLQITSTVLDIFFAVRHRTLHRGRTSPSFVFFVFAIIATAYRERFQATITVTACSAILSAPIITSSRGATQSVYLMRPIYLAIAGYLISSLGEQRVAFETRVRDLETRSQRLAIARSLHDGLIQ